MNFFEHQKEAKSHTRWLIFLFLSSVLAVVVSINLVLYFVLSANPHFDLQQNISVFVITSAVIVATILVGSAYKFYQISDGGISVALMLDAKSVDPSTRNPDERKLLNIVEEMAIASGVPVPEVFLLENETGINAFAAGYLQKDAVITVTSGAIRHLNRDELQGVIAHEFSHILNSDTKLNMQLLGLTSGIAVLAYAGRFIMQGTPNSSTARGRNSGQIFLVGLTLFVLGFIGVFLAKLIKSAISRECEYLADASAVQFTRNPGGIAGALKKIGGSSMGSAVSHGRADELSHFFFNEADGDDGGLLATHPPLLKRIQVIEPQFDGKFTPVEIEAKDEPRTAGVKLTDYDKRVIEKRQQSGDSRKIAPIAVAAWNSSIGVVAIPREGTSDLSTISDQLRARARQPYHSRNIFYALFLSSIESYREKQIEALNKSLSAPELTELKENFAEIARLDRNKFHLSILNLCLPTLKNYSEDQFAQLAANLKSICESDESLTLLEYASFKLIKNYRLQLYDKKLPVKFSSIDDVKNSVVILLSAIAYASSEQANEILDAFSAGTRKLALSIFTPVPNSECGLSQLEKAFDQLRLTSPGLKQKIIAAAMESVLWNKQLNQNEAALLQVAAAVMGVPLPSLEDAAKLRSFGI